MSKARAITLARQYVSIHGRGISWTIIGPYRSGDPSGPSTERSADSYASARRIASAWIAHVALTLMGRATDDAYFAVDDARMSGIADVRALVNIGMQA